MLGLYHQHDLQTPSGAGHNCRSPSSCAPGWGPGSQSTRQTAAGTDRAARALTPSLQGERKREGQLGEKTNFTLIIPAPLCS